MVDQKMTAGIQVSAKAFEYARRLVDIADHLQRELEMSGGDVAQGAAVFAGFMARCNARPGAGSTVGMISAAIVQRLAAGTESVN